MSVFQHGLRGCLAVGVALSLLSPTARATEPERPAVVYAGLMYAAEPAEREARFPYTNAMGEALVTLSRRQLRAHGAQLPFEVLQHSDNTLALDSAYLTLAFVLTSENVLGDAYDLGADGRFYQAFCDLSLVALVFDAASRRVVSSFPVSAVAPVRLERPLTAADVRQAFSQAAATGLQTALQRLERVALATVQARVAPAGEGYRLDRGERDGALPGAVVTFLDATGASIGKGTLEQVQRDQAVARLVSGQAGPVARFMNLKLSSDETYQVTDILLSSAKAQALFGDSLAQRMAQWFSDYYSAAGHLVLPPRLGGQWADKGRTAVLQVYPLDGEALPLELATPRHPLKLELSGLATSELESNEVERWRLFKAWTKATLDDGGRALEVDEVVKKREVIGAHAYSEKEVYLDAIQQSLSKLAKSL